MEMNIDEMKPQWQSAQKSINPGLGFDSRRRTSIQRLADRYRRFAWLALLMIALNMSTLYRLQSLWLGVGFVLIMLASSAMDFYLLDRITSTDLTRMSVRDVLFRIMDCRKKHLTFVAFVMPCAFLWCLALVYLHRLDNYFVIGAVSGAIIGAFIGWRVLSRFLRDYREALEE